MLNDSWEENLGFYWFWYFCNNYYSKIFELVYDSVFLLMNGIFPFLINGILSLLYSL